MTFLDNFLRRLRIAQVESWIPQDARVLDVGCDDGALFERMGGRIRAGLGVDPNLREGKAYGCYELLIGGFPEAIPLGVAPFDVITMLAVFEHVPAELHENWARECHRLLVPGGLLLLTVPSPWVDPILDVLRALRLVHGMSLEQHHGFHAGHTPELFGPHGFTLVKHSRFELGLNHFFAFQRK